MPLRRRLFARKGGAIAVRIPAAERAALATVLDEVRDLLQSEDLDVPRLFPTAYPDHPGLDAEYQRYMRSELLTSRLSALETVAGTADAKSIDGDEANAWLMSMNAARVTVGSLLGIDHDGWSFDDLGQVELGSPEVRLYVIYELLGAMLYDLLDVLMDGGVQEPDPDDPRIE